MKKRIVPLLALVLSLCILIPVSVAQSAAEGAVQISVTAENGKVKIGDTSVNNGGTHSVRETEPAAAIQLEAVPNNGYAFKGWSATGGTASDSSSAKTQLTIGSTSESVSLTATFAKTVSVTLEQPENGSISRTDTLTTLTAGSVVELKAEGASGYGLLHWIIKDSTGADTTDYTLTQLGNTAKLTLGETDLKISAAFSTDAGSFVWDENDSNKNATAQLRDGTKGIYVVDDVKITGWNNNAKEDLVITLTPTEDPRKAPAPNLFFQIGNAMAGFNSSAKVEFKDAAKVVDAGKRIKNKTVTYADGYAWEELPFTITDANNKVKNGKIVINYPSKVTVNAVNGTVKVNGSVCNSGSTLQFMADETVSIEAVAAGEGYTFQGWTTSATLADRSQTATTLTTTAGTFSLTATFAKPSDEKTYLSFKWMCDGQDLSGVEHWMLSGGFSDMPYWIYSFADEVTFNEAIENPTKRQWLGSSDEMQSGVAAGTKLLIRLKTQHTFQNDTYLLDNVDISSIPENSLLGNKRAADGNNEMCYVGLKMDGNLSVTANYHKAANVKITADVNDTAMGTVELSPVGTAGYYQEQTTLAMMAVAQDGYRFKEWQEANGTTYLSQSQKTKAMVEFVVGDKPASFAYV
ncbi:MAG: InlB B-repeat-containing protein [Oscillospiraceae bacterium]